MGKSNSKNNSIILSSNNPVKKISTAVKSYIYSGYKKMRYRLSGEIKKDQETVKKLGFLEEFGTYHVSAFKYHALNKLKSEKRGTLFMLDINDLYMANKVRGANGKKQVNILIKNMIDSMKESMENNGLSDNIIGKMGDEVYVYSETNDKDITYKVVEEFKKIRGEELSFSVGVSSDFSKGLNTAIIEAEENMMIHKKNIKNERLRKICGENISKIASHVLAKHIDKMRINLECLKNESDIVSLRGTFNKAIDSIEVSDIFNNDNESLEMGTSEFETKIDNIKGQAIVSVGSDKEKVETYVLSRILKEGINKDSIKMDYLRKIAIDSLIKKVGKNNNSNFKIASFSVSGLKAVNDKYGHDEGDAAISDTIEQVSKIMKEIGFVPVIPIIEKQGGDFFAIIDSKDKESEKNLSEELEKRNSSKETEKMLSVNAVFQKLEFEEFSKCGVLKSIDRALKVSDTKLDEMSKKRKLTDVSEMRASIISCFKEVCNSADVEMIKNYDFRTHDKVTNILKSEFENILNNSNNIECIEISKEKENEKEKEEEKEIS